MILTRVYWMGLLSVLKTLTEKYETLFYYGKNYDTLRKTRESQSTLAINYRDWSVNKYVQIKPGTEIFCNIKYNIHFIIFNIYIYVYTVCVL